MENFGTELFVLSPHHKAKFFLLCAAGMTLHGLQIWAASTASLVHVWVILKDPLVGPWGVVLGLFDPRYVPLGIRVMYTDFTLQTIP